MGKTKFEHIVINDKAIAALMKERQENEKLRATLAKTAKRLSVLRQQNFNNAPELDIDNMGVIVMPFIAGSSVMAKMLGDHWEFGYCRDRSHKVQREPYITATPHDRRLVQLSKDIQEHIGHRCEIEYIISPEGEIHVVQAKDISHIETLSANAKK